MIRGIARYPPCKLGRLCRGAVIGVVLAGWYLRLVSLANRSPWFDEALEVFQGIRFPTTFVSIIMGERVLLYDPPGYYALLSALERISLEVLWLRMPSLVGGLLAIVFTWRAGIACGSRLGALGAATIVALSPTAVYFSQEINQYGVVMGISALILWTICRVSRHRTRARLVYLVAAIVVGLWTHYSFLFVLAATAPALWVSSFGRGRRWKRALVWAAVAAFLGAALLVPLWIRQVRMFSSPEVSPLFPHPPLAEVAERLCEVLFALLYTGIGLPGKTGWGAGSAHAIWALVLTLVGFLGLARGQARMVSVVVALGILAVGVAYWMGAYPLGGWLGRHQVVWVPFLAFTIGVGVEQAVLEVSSLAASRGVWPSVGGGSVARRVVYVAAVGVLAVLMVALNGWYASHNPQITYLGAVLQDLEVDAEDTIFVYYGSLPTVAYSQLSGQMGDENQLAARDSIQSVREWPTACWSASLGSECKIGNVVYSPWLRGSPAEAHFEALEARLGYRPEAVWVVFSHVWGQEREELLAYLSHAGWCVDQTLVGHGAWAHHVRSGTPHNECLVGSGA